MARTLQLRVQSEARALHLFSRCAEIGRQARISIDPDEPEDIRELERLLRPVFGKSSRITPSAPLRNAPCPCGSGSKYKNCCGRRGGAVALRTQSAATSRLDRVSRSTAPRCGLCGSTKKLVRTECCGNWICDDESEYRLFSYARNSCSRNHRRLTICGAHHTEGHDGHWKDCAECGRGWATELYVYYGTNEYNFEKLEDPPEFEPTHCSGCGVVIRLGEDGYSILGDAYACEECGPAVPR